MTQQGFKFGFVLTVAIFVALNVASFFTESSVAADMKRNLDLAGIQLSAGGYSFGFPFTMYFNQMGNPNRIGFESIPTILNIVIALTTGSLVGMVVQSVIRSFRKSRAQ